jgi:hypothetical protein
MIKYKSHRSAIRWNIFSLLLSVGNGYYFGMVAAYTRNILAAAIAGILLSLAVVSLGSLIFHSYKEIHHDQ